jgi:hypothetical protein
VGTNICGFCRIEFDPMMSDANARYSFCKREHEQQYEPGVLHEAGVRRLLACPSGLCSLDEDPDSSLDFTRKD